MQAIAGRMRLHQPRSLHDYPGSDNHPAGVSAVDPTGSLKPTTDLADPGLLIALKLNYITLILCSRACSRS
jgi:hypothetical protein